MNIWTVFFLVVSAVILASPLLSSTVVVRNGSGNGRSRSGRPDRPDPEDSALELDLASGRLTREDYEVMTGLTTRPDETVEGNKGTDGSLSEG
jgi:hypothetical protein